MTESQASYEPPGRVLSLSARLSDAESVATAVTHAIALVDTVCDQPVASVCTYDPETGTVSTLESGAQSSIGVTNAPKRIFESLLNREGGDDAATDGTVEVTVNTNTRGPVRAEALVPVGGGRVLRVGVTEPEEFDDAEIAAIEGIAANLRTALARIDGRRSTSDGCDLARALFDQSNEAAFVSDTDGTLVAVNRAAVELTGRDRDALLTNGLPDIAPETEAGPVRAHLDRTASGTPNSLVTSLEHTRDGAFRVELTSQLVGVDGSTYVRTIAHGPSSKPQLSRERPADPTGHDTAALRRLNELTVNAGEFDETIGRLLSLGCETFGLDTGILSRVDGGDYEVDVVVDETGSHEAGTVYDLTDTMCDATLAGDVTGTLAFADVAVSDHRDNPAAGNVSAYIAAPVVANGDTYGTVNFSMRKPRSAAFRPEEREFIKLIAQHIGTEIERRRRFAELERYETILEAVDDPVYALDTDGRFTFVNTAAEREFGYDEDVIGKYPAIGMDDSDVERMEAQIESLLTTGDRSTTTEFELETADGDRKTVENRLALIGDEEFRGTAGVLRDITDRKERRRQLESFQRAIDEAADGIAILDGGEYTYVDRTHVEMYGFEAKDELLGNTWRKLYAADEVERLEAEAFPALEADGHWRGTVTGSRPDGSTFPAELSLTIIGDGRLVCAVRDETERRARERELESFQRAVESARDGVAILDGGEYTYVDRTHAEMYGFEAKDELLGNTWRKLYAADEVERLEAEAFPALEADGHWRGTVTGSRPDGSTFPAELSLTVVEDGRLVCTVRDETERRARERELKLKERAMDEATVGIQITDATQDGNPLVYVNDGFERMTGYARADAIGRNPRFLQGEDSDPDQVARLREAIDSEEPISIELRNYREDGTPYWTRVSVAPVTDEEGVVTNYVGIQQDVTDRKEHTQWLRQFLNEGPLLFVETREVDGKPVIDSCNDQLLNRLGYDREEVEGSPLASIYTPDSASKLREEGYERALDGEFGVSERELVGSDGESVYALLRAVPRRDETSGTNALFVDISKRRERERETEARVELLERIYEVTTDPQTSFAEKINGLLDAGRDHLDLPYGFLTRIDTGEESTARTQRIVEGAGPHELLQPGESRPLSESYCRLTIENDGTTGLVNAAESELVDDAAYETFGLETYVGGKVDVNDRVFGTLCFASSEQRERPFDEFERSLVSLLGQWAGYEIERRDAREELRQQQERLELTLSETQTGIADWDLTDGTVQWNETLIDVIGQDIETFEEFEALVHPEDRERVERELERMLETGEPWIGDLRLRRTDGTYLWQGVRAVPKYDDAGNPVRVLTVATDITDRKERQRQLEREREQFKLLVESIDEYAFVIVDGDGVIQTWNTGASGLFGYDSETAVGMSMGRLYPESDRDSELPGRLLQQARIAGESAHEGWQARADGTEFYADVRYAPLETDDGGFHGYAMVARDMTDPRRQQRRTERFVEESTDVVTIVDTDGTVEYASGSADRVLGHDRDDLVGTNLFDYLHPESREDAMEAFFAGVDDPDADIRAEWRIESGDGAWLNVESQCRNMLEDDAIGGMLLYLRDVTEDRKRARRFESIFNQTFQFTGLLEPDGTVVEVNDAALAFGGFDRSDVVGTPFQEVDWWSHSDTVHTRVRDAIRRAASGEFVRYETDVRGGNGLATIDFSVKPVTNEDGEVSLLVVEGRDVTTRNQHRRHLEVMQRVMRHNMRNDLTKVRGWTELMAEETDADKRAEQFEVIERILDKWRAMTEKMKQIRSVLGSRQGREAKRDVGALVEAAVAPVREEYAGATVATDVPDDGLPVPVELLDAVRELVENAAKASTEAAIEVTVDRSVDGWTEVLVRDDGPGMPDMEASVLETGEESQLNHGQGLGLWMVRMIVTQAGGDASVESTSDGTEVCLRLPERQTMESERSGRTVE